MRSKYMIIRKDNGTCYNEDANVFCKCGTIYKNKQKAIQKMEYAKKYTKLQVTKGEKVFHTLTCSTLKEAQEIMKLMTIDEDQFFLITPMLNEKPLEAYIYRANHQHV